MSDEVRRNDFLVYESLTRADGPAMTWSMFVELADFDKADQLFQRSYQTYVRPPFNVSYLNIFSFILFEFNRYGQKLNQVLVQLIL
jgi:hypothetical protein